MKPGKSMNADSKVPMARSTRKGRLQFRLLIGLICAGGLFVAAIDNQGKVGIQAADASSCTHVNGALAWNCGGPIPGWTCTQILEPADPHTWNDNYLCASGEIGAVWSYAGPRAGMRCTQILEPADPHTWTDNYLCVPHNSPYYFQWSFAGPIPGNNCIQWDEPADPHTWADNYLCW